MIRAVASNKQESVLTWWITRMLCLAFWGNKSLALRVPGRLSQVAANVCQAMEALGPSIEAQISSRVALN